MSYPIATLGRKMQGLQGLSDGGSILGGSVQVPFSAMPTVREFIARAVRQGCTEGRAKRPLYGPRGPVLARYLSAPAPRRTIVILPESDNERLTSGVLGHYVRALGVTGYEHLLIDETYDED